LAKTRGLDVDGVFWRYRLSFNYDGRLQLEYWRPWIPGARKRTWWTTISHMTPDMVANVIRGRGPRRDTAAEALGRSLRR
jgi:hypothetical protein